MRNPVHITIVPSSTRRVASAMADRIVQHSWMPVVSPPNRNNRWSYTQTESRPVRSAATAAARIASYDMIPFGPPSVSAIGRTMPTRIG